MITGTAQAPVVCSVPAIFFGESGSPGHRFEDVAVEVRDGAASSSEIALRTTSPLVSASWLEPRGERFRVSLADPGNFTGLFDEAVILTVHGVDVRLPVRGRIAP
jgi:hypothetical protein